MMPRELKPHYYKELSAYAKALLQNQWQQAWRHLERAHIIGQAYPLEHTHVHWLMLKFGFRIKDAREIFGQVPRLLVGGVKSFIGIIPVGNTGGANVPPLKSMDIPEDLQELLNYNNHDCNR
jgi:hypothetical protein